jgi:hypothetical protein
MPRSCNTRFAGTSFSNNRLRINAPRKNRNSVRVDSDAPQNLYLDCGKCEQVQRRDCTSLVTSVVKVWNHASPCFPFLASVSHLTFGQATLIERKTPQGAGDLCGDKQKCEGGYKL